MRIPSPFEMGEVAFRESCVIEDDGGFRVMRLQFETHYGVKAGLPSGGEPRLDGTLVGEELSAASLDELAGGGEGRACPGIDFGRHACQRGELLGAKKQLVDALLGGVEGDLVMQR